MEMVCAECGCLVERGVVLRACATYPRCCCELLPEAEVRAPSRELR